MRGQVVEARAFVVAQPRARQRQRQFDRLVGHAFGALVFAEHAESESFELGQSRISKLYISDGGGHEVANFDRGWDRQPTTPAAKAIVDLLAAGLAELVFGK